MPELDDTTKAMPTDEELSKASEAAEEVKEEEVKEEEVEEKEEEKEEVKEEDNSERSRLGRKVANLERNMSLFMEEIRSTLTKPVEKEPEEEVGFEQDDYVKKSDLEKYFTERAYKIKKQEDLYRNAYSVSMVELTKELDEKTFEELMPEVDERYGKTRTGNPKLDAQMDYLASYNKILSKKVTKKSSPLEKNEKKEGKGLGVNGGTKGGNAKSKVPELDPEALEFAKKMGMKPEDIEDALTKDSPTLNITRKTIDLSEI